MPRLNVDKLHSGLVCRRKHHASAERAARENLRFYACSVLGSGTYGKVFQCWDAQERQHVAVKQFCRQWDRSSTDQLEQASYRELAILKRCSHPNIVPIIALLFDSAHQTYFGAKFEGGFAMPLCRGGDLHHWLEDRYYRRIDIPIDIKQSLAHQLLSAVCYLHKRSIVHRDIKPGNCMVNEDGSHLYLGDFGLGRQCTVPLRPWYTSEVCTLMYRPPELLLGAKSYGINIDVWSAGLTVARLFAEGDIFAQHNQIGMVYDIFSVFGTPSLQEWPEMAKMRNYTAEALPRWRGSGLASRLSDANKHLVLPLLNGMLQCVPERRTSAKQALQDDFFKHCFRTKTRRAKKRPASDKSALRRRRIRIRL